MKKKFLLYAVVATLLCSASIIAWSVTDPDGRASAAATVSGPSVSDPTNPAKPTDPTNPAKPTDPTNPAKPTDPTNPAKPTDPTNPAKPTDPADPTNPAKPTDPANPTNPAKPTDPANPTNPVNPTKPGETQKPGSGSGSSSNSGGGSNNNNNSTPAQNNAASTNTYLKQEEVGGAIQSQIDTGKGQVVLNTTATVKSSDLRKIQESGKPVVIFAPNVSWHFANLTNPDAELIPTVEMNANIPAISSKLNGVTATVIRFEHNGVLPGTAYVGLQVSYAPGTTLYFYYFNHATGMFEYQQTTRVEAGGYAVVTLTHCSDYVLTTTPLTSNVASGTVPAVQNPGRLDSTPHTGI